MTGSLRGDVKLAARSLARRPLLAVTVVATLALGIGANTAVFSVVEGVLLRPLDYPHPEELVVLWESEISEGAQRQRVSPPNFLDWRQRGSAFAALAALTREAPVLAGDDGPVRLAGVAVSGTYFDVVQTRPLAGRVLRRDDEDEGAQPVAVISAGLWRSRFGGEPGIVGRSLTLDERERTIVGVVPDDSGVAPGTQVWRPLSFAPEELTDAMRGARYLDVVGRLAPGVSSAAAAERLAALSAAMASESPQNRGWTAGVKALHEEVVGGSRPALLLLLAAVGLVLAIACANVAGLLLARGADRESEVAVRLALGAGRARLLRTVLAESVVLAVVGGAAGVALAFWGLDSLLALMPRATPRIDQVGIDGAVLGWSVLLCVFSAVGFGLLPALRAARIDPARAMAPRGGVSGGSESGRRVLVAVQTALALVLLAGAGLMVRSLAALRAVDSGVSSDGVLTTSLSLSGSRYGGEDARREFFARLVERTAALPGVAAAGAATNLPFSGSNMTFGFRVADAPLGDPTEQHFAEYHAVTPGYFAALGIRLREGRSFAAGDGPGSERVAVVNRTLARRFWGDASPLGATIAVAYGGMAPRRIVGVVDDVTHFGLASGARPEVYVPSAQDPWPFAALVVRPTAAASSLGAAVREVVRSLDADLPVGSLGPLDSLVDVSLAPVRFRATLLACFGGFAVVLAAVGLYGVAAAAVVRRRREIGVRMALGATSGSVERGVIAQALRPVVVGAAIGLAGAAGFARLAKGLLFGVRPFDPLTLLAVTGALLAVAALACWVPARRAARIDPAAALRWE